MWYLLDKNNNIITTADDDYKFMVDNLLSDFKDSQVLNYVPRKIVDAAPIQPTTTGTVTI
jgi:hypothetical protein